MNFDVETWLNEHERKNYDSLLDEYSACELSDVESEMIEAAIAGHAATALDRFIDAVERKQ